MKKILACIGYTFVGMILIGCSRSVEVDFRRIEKAYGQVNEVSVRAVGRELLHVDSNAKNQIAAGGAEYVAAMADFEESRCKAYIELLKIVEKVNAKCREKGIAPRYDWRSVTGLTNPQEKIPAATKALIDVQQD